MSGRELRKVRRNIDGIKRQLATLNTQITNVWQNFVSLNNRIINLETFTNIHNYKPDVIYISDDTDSENSENEGQPINNSLLSDNDHESGIDLEQGTQNDRIDNVFNEINALSSEKNTHYSEMCLQKTQKIVGVENERTYNKNTNKDLSSDINTYHDAEKITKSASLSNTKTVNDHENDTEKVTETESSSNSKTVNDHENVSSVSKTNYNAHSSSTENTVIECENVTRQRNDEENEDSSSNPSSCISSRRSSDVSDKYLVYNNMTDKVFKTELKRLYKRNNHDNNNGANNKSFLKNNTDNNCILQDKDNESTENVSKKLSQKRKYYNENEHEQLTKHIRNCNNKLLKKKIVTPVENSITSVSITTRNNSSSADNTSMENNADYQEVQKTFTIEKTNISHENKSDKMCLDSATTCNTFLQLPDFLSAVATELPTGSFEISEAENTLMVFDKINYIAKQIQSSRDENFDENIDATLIEAAATATNPLPYDNSNVFTLLQKEGSEEQNQNENELHSDLTEAAFSENNTVISNNSTSPVSLSLKTKRKSVMNKKTVPEKTKRIPYYKMSPFPNEEDEKRRIR